MLSRKVTRKSQKSQKSPRSASPPPLRSASRRGDATSGTQEGEDSPYRSPLPCRGGAGGGVSNFKSRVGIFLTPPPTPPLIGVGRTAENAATQPPAHALGIPKGDATSGTQEGAGYLSITPHPLRGGVGGGVKETLNLHQIKHKLLSFVVRVVLKHNYRLVFLRQQKPLDQRSMFLPSCFGKRLLSSPSGKRPLVERSLKYKKPCPLAPKWG